MTQLEREIEQKLIDMVKRHGGKCLKWVCPGWAGVPDRIILLPGGRIMFVETKRPKGSIMAKRQEWWKKELRRLGFWCATVWTPGDVQMLDLIIRDELDQSGAGEAKRNK